MKTIDMGGFENQKLNVSFAGENYTIDLDAPAEIYRQFYALKRPPETEEEWDDVKDWVAGFIGYYNKIDKKKFAKTLTKGACIRFINGYQKFLVTSVKGDSKKVGKQKKAAG